MRNKIIGLMLMLLMIALPTTLAEQVPLSVTSECYINGTIVISDDMDSTDGDVLYLYNAWILENPNGVVIDEKTLTQVHNGSILEKTFFDVDNIGTYTMTANFFYVQQDFNFSSMAWETTESGSCGVDSQTIDVIPPNPDPNIIMQIINVLYNLWRNLFN